MYRVGDDSIITFEEPWATCFRLALTEAAERVFGLYEDPDDPETFGIPVFDRLTKPQKVAMLATVGQALLDRETPAPELTAVVEGTLAVLLEVFRDLTIVESEAFLDDPSAEDATAPWATECRRTALAIYSPGWNAKECGPLPKIEGGTAKEWKELLENLEEIVMWDEDYLNEAPFLDTPKTLADLLKMDLDVDVDYFTALAPEPSKTQLIQYVATIQQLTGVKFDPSKAAD